MPRIAQEASSRFNQVQQQAQKLLADLRKQIQSKEDELRRLKDEDSKLSGLLGLSANGRNGAVSQANGAGGRVNWMSVLEQLPKQFKARDVYSVRGVQNKRASEVFAAITRWIEAKSVKRMERGLYERTETKSKSAKKNA
jgi:hypothetical protein